MADSGVAACAARAQSSIDTPATFEIALSRVAGSRVILTFDSENSSGALIRADRHCDFRLDPLAGFYFTDDPYWDWLSCETTGEPESPGVDCGATAAAFIVFAAGIATKYPIPPTETGLAP